MGANMTKFLFKKIIGTLVIVFIATKITHIVVWNNRKHILKDRGFFYKSWFYISHYLEALI
jgi:hypothetical protein